MQKSPLCKEILNIICAVHRMEVSMPTLSIIVPCYNAQKYLNECIDSILKQTFRDFELIFINDGSCDNTLDILNEYKQKDNRIVILNQDNQGPGPAVINGIKLAKGEYVGFVDSDDWVKETMFETLIANIKAHDADLVQCGCLINGTSINRDLTSDKKCIFNDIKIELLKPFFEESASLYPVTNARWNKLYKKVLVDKIINIVFKDVLIGEDLLFNIYYLNICNKVVVLKDENNYNYRTNLNSISNKHTFKKQAEQLKLFDKLKEYAKNAKYEFSAIDFLKKDTICSLMLDTLLSNFSKEEKLENIKFLCDILNDDKHIKLYAKQRPFVAKIVLFFILHKKYKLLINILGLIRKNNCF